jgi:hypothetical protein
VLVSWQVPTMPEVANPNETKTQNKTSETETSETKIENKTIERKIETKNLLDQRMEREQVMKRQELCKSKFFIFQTHKLIRPNRCSLICY